MWHLKTTPVGALSMFKKGTHKAINIIGGPILREMHIAEFLIIRRV